MADVISVEKMEKILTEIEKRECDSPQEEIHRIRAIGDIRLEIDRELICQHEQRQALEKAGWCPGEVADAWRY